VLLGCVAAGAIMLPAHRAAQVDPADEEVRLSFVRRQIDRATQLSHGFPIRFALV